MKIDSFFFDARFIRVEHHDGISRFSVGLFNEIAKFTPVTAIISDERQLAKLPAGTKWVKLNAPTSVAEPFIALKLNRLGAKVVFSPMQTIGSFGRKFKLVLTLHDLIYYRHPTPPSSFNVAIRALWRIFHLSYWPQRWLLNRSDLVVTVSKTTQGLIAQHRLTKRPTAVVYNAAETALEAANNIEMPSFKNRKSVVYMGSFMPYKNVETLIKAAALTANLELQLLSRIHPKRQLELQSLADETGADVKFFNGVSEADYHDLLTKALALASASLDEGFGIPLVEAMQRGIPVVASDIEIFREISGAAGQLCQPESAPDFAGAFENLQNATYWQEQSKAAIQQAEQFNWNASAKKLLELLRQL